MVAISQNQTKVQRAPSPKESLAIFLRGILHFAYLSATLSGRG